jgi:hypothetical protein
MESENFYSFSSDCWVLFFCGILGGGEFQGKVSCSSDVFCFSGYFLHEILILANIFALVSHKGFPQTKYVVC